LPRQLPVFLVDLGRADLLLAAMDFYAAASQAEFRLEGPSRGGPALLFAKGRAHVCLALEKEIERLFSPEPPAEDELSTAFLAKGHGGARAYLLRRRFEMLSLPARDFRLLPLGIRARQASRGIVALRFEGAGRLQLLMNPGLLRPEDDQGGAPSESS
jgi:hypothetical protein